jgi:exonuclease SbcC
MYIKKIVLENFQAFERGEFELSPHLNILVGVSNVGKSSVARALSLVLYNQWDKSWVRFGTKSCRITLETSTGITVVREKGDKLNRYILRLPNSPEQVFDSFGTTTPEQIQQALKIHEVQIDTTDKLNLNLAGQMDALFLLSQTGSYRAKVLGKLSGVTYLDHAIRGLNKSKRETTAEKDREDEKILGLQAQVDKFSALEAFSEPIAALESRLSSLVRSQERIDRIRLLLERVNAFKDDMAREQQKAAFLTPLDLTRLEKLPARVDKIKAVRSLLSTADNFKQTFTRETKLNEILTPVNLSGIDKLAGKSSNTKIIKTLFDREISCNAQQLRFTGESERIDTQLQAATARYTEILRENKVCPTCNQATEHLCVQ